MSFICSCKRNNREIVIVVVPEVLIKSPTQKYLSLWHDVLPLVADCEKDVSCICADNREISLINNKECISIVFECSHSNLIVRAFMDYCRNFISDRERAEIRARRFKEAPGSHRKYDLGKIATMQNFRCYFCDKKLYWSEDLDDEQQLGKICHWDHLKPLSRGGTNFPSNMALTCRECNLAKGKRTEKEYWLHLSITIPEEDINKRQRFHRSYSIEKNKLDLPYKKK